MGNTATVIKNPALLLCIYMGVDAGFFMTVTVPCTIVTCITSAEIQLLMNKENSKAPYVYLSIELQYNEIN